MLIPYEYIFYVSSDSESEASWALPLDSCLPTNGQVVGVFLTALSLSNIHPFHSAVLGLDRN